jgi:uncharacterized protein YdeI (YjbR/CyaY-like superfamily)
MTLPNSVEAADRAAWRLWLAEHYASAHEVWLVLYKKACGLPSVTYEEAIEEALCFGWIDGLIRGIDEQRHTRRFTPRLPGSRWSAVNLARVRKIVAEGRMTPIGLALLPSDWQEDTPKPAPPPPDSLPEFIQTALESAPGLRVKFDTLTPGLRRIYLRYILDAKREETRLKRLTFVLDHVERGEKIDFMKPLK